MRFKTIFLNVYGNLKCYIDNMEEISTKQREGTKVIQNMLGAIFLFSHFRDSINLFQMVR